MSPERMSAEQGERCQLCGSLVEVVSSDEGTSYYRPAEQGDAICIHCGAEVFWGLPRPEDPCFECGKPVAEQGDVEALTAAADRALYDLTLHTSKSDEWAREREALVHAELDRLAAALERAERERDGNARGREGWQRTAEGWRLDFHREKDRAEKAERALAEIADYIGAEFREGDKAYQVAIVARVALRPSEEASDES